MAKCTWCGNAVEPTDGFRLAEHAGDRGAVFCRLEHVVPWAMQGAHWEAGEPLGAGRHRQHHARAPTAGPSWGRDTCVLVRHRGEHRIPDGFCSVGHLVEWAKAGGRWQ